MAEQKNALTPKQEAFALAYVETGNAAEAYRRAYDVRAQTPPLGCYVYVLVEAGAERVLYVGKGTGLRMHAHMRDVRAGRVGCLKKYLGLAQVVEDGGIVEARCVEDRLTPTAAVRFERHLIGRIGLDRLLNSAAGGSTADERALARAKRLVADLTAQFGSLTGQRLALARQLAAEAQQAADLAVRNIQANV